MHPDLAEIATERLAELVVFSRLQITHPWIQGFNYEAPEARGPDVVQIVQRN